MIIVKSLLLFFLIIFSVIYLANSVAAILILKKETINYFLWSGWLLSIGGVATFLCIIISMLFIITNLDNKPIDKPKYELVTEPVYREVK